jgi:hypothetical protein
MKLLVMQFDNSAPSQTLTTDISATVLVAEETVGVWPAQFSVMN